LRIGKGWRKQVQERLGGVRGCTHLVELALGAMATAAIQTIVPLRAKEKPAEDGRAGFLDTCHALAADSPVVAAHWPQLYTGKN
jgi:hypothetical protein